MSKVYKYRHTYLVVSRWEFNFHLSVCVLHIISIFPLVDIQHSQRPCRCSNPRDTRSVQAQKETQHCETQILPGTSLCSKQSRQQQAAVKCHVCMSCILPVFLRLFLVFILFYLAPRSSVISILFRPFLLLYC